MRTNHLLFISLGLNLILIGGGVTIFFTQPEQGSFLSKTSAPPTLTRPPMAGMHPSIERPASVNETLHFIPKETSSRRSQASPLGLTGAAESTPPSTAEMGSPPSLTERKPSTAPPPSRPALKSDPGVVVAERPSQVPGIPSSPGIVPSTISPPPGPAVPSSPIATAIEPVLSPAALVPNEPSIPITTEQQVVEWEKLQDDFIADVGDLNLDLTNADNQALWRAARQQNDALFRAKFGWQAFLQQNAAAGRQAESR